jgi:hypothetical protein
MSPIPEFKQSGVLPPYTTPSPAHRGQGNAGLSPHLTTITELVERLGSSNERKKILLGFLNFRKELRSHGLPMEWGFMWLDGSFCEELQGREPGDIDLIMFFKMPTEAELAAHQITMRDFLTRAQTMQLALFTQSWPKNDPQGVWIRYRCDAFLVWVQRDEPAQLMRETLYWYGLFSHRRDTQEWKGMLRVELAEEPGEQELRAQLEAEIGEVTL